MTKITCRLFLAWRMQFASTVNMLSLSRLSCCRIGLIFQINDFDIEFAKPDLEGADIALAVNGFKLFKLREG
ncbi:hypothetical protein GOC40_29190 [Sinorhizobium meliloti]|nr:hypothetical protein [Sinorhizobium meliloti]MDE3820193.1 hypothetical protein [Sinorhizobium meliloti]MDE3831003.1 hypothetical protein [Sinorhizobium meliloti]MDE4579871.1 hypothetical protein [Sinorhizobium meliloti]MDW9461224.1 hypothetical protein [Sinorhizobium meliloti]MDW9546257.1 hypothetical protein [Sinorhizobium meliloti]